MTKDYPEILSGTDNVWIIGITQESSTQDYYLVFHHEIDTILDEHLHLPFDDDLQFIQDVDINEIEEIGSGGYATVHTAKYKNASEELVVLKRFKNFEEMTDMFIFEVGDV